MLKSIKALIQQEKEIYRIPKNVRDLIPVDALWKDGIFRKGRKFSKTYCFTDINYRVASLDNKQGMFDIYMNILNSFDSNAVTKITINNRQMNRCDVEASVLVKEEGDSLDVLRKEYNGMLSELALVDNGVTQEKYITDWQRHQNRNNNFSASIPYDMEQQRNELNDLIVAVQEDDQRLVCTVFTMIITADSKEELEAQTENLMSFAQVRMCQIAPLTFQQLDGLNTVLKLWNIY